MFRSLRSRMGSAVPSSSEQNHINGDARGDSHPASSYMPQVARDSSGANRIGSHFYPPPDDDPPPPYTETITTSDVGSRNISDQTAHVPVSESEDTTALMSVPVPACETLADNARGRATTPTIAQQASFYAPVSSSITGGFDSGNDIGDSSVETAAGSLDDYAMVHTPAHSARPVFRYQKTSEDIFSNFDLAPPPLNSVSAVASSTPRAHRGYGSIAVSILDDLDGTPFSNVADGTQDGNDALHAPVPEETGDFSFGQRYQQTEVADDHSPAVVVSHQRVHANRVSDQKECPICAETKSLSGFPIFSVTPTCLHAPETCLECLRMAIRTELNDRHWKDIRCPECRELLEYVDVQRYADEQTFTRYENLALRAAMHQADNFIWCTAGCGSGQIHDTGVEQPIVNCLHCSQRSCFTHEVAWHDGLTCDEYDSLIADPENFRSRIEIENAAIEEEGARRRAQDAADCAMARGLAASQEAEERARQQREEQERKRAVKAAEETRRAAARRKREDEKSIALVGKTTKKCPGCTWAIEKNRGCSHMTCIRCNFEFCWECLADHQNIMTRDNSAHKKTCKFHPDNLDEEYMGQEDQVA